MVLSLPHKQYSQLREHSWKVIQQYAVHGLESTAQRILPITRTFTGNSFSSMLYMVLSLPHKEYSHLCEHSREIHSAVCCAWFWVYRTKNTPTYANIHGKFIQQYAVHGFESTVQRILPLTRTFTGNSLSSTSLWCSLHLKTSKYGI